MLYVEEDKQRTSSSTQPPQGPGLSFLKKGTLNPFPLMLSPPPQRKGMFVDYEESQGETKTHIFTFTNATIHTVLSSIFQQGKTYSNGDNITFGALLIYTAEAEKSVCVITTGGHVWKFGCVTPRVGGPLKVPGRKPEHLSVSLQSSRSERLHCSTSGENMQSINSPGGRVLSEDQFSCSICLEVFVEPVSTPCGHSFCKACLQGYWNHSKKYSCPMCKKSYSKKPEMSVNRVLAEISSQFQGLMMDGGTASRGSTLNLSSDTGHTGSPGPDTGEFARAGEVPCDACIGRKLKALKSCVNCPGSFCEAHLRHHKKVKSLTSHRLIEPTFHLEEKICKKHERLLDAYCRTDHTCICMACAEASHKSHDIVSSDHEWKKKMSNLGKKRSELKHLIKERAKKLEEIKQSIKVIKAGAQKELEESWQVFAELQRLVEQSQAELVEQIATRQREAERHAQELARGLENELSQLRRRSNELEAYAQTQDKVVFLQNLGTLPLPLEPNDWSAVSINTDLYLGTIRSSVSSLMDKFQEELKRLYGKELRKVQNYSSEVIMDPATAQRNLVVSDDGRQVRYEERKTPHAEGPKRFSPALFVLGREGLCSGRHYWEVDVGRKTAWTLGLVRASARRKGEIKLSPEGGYWCLWLKNGEVKALASSRLPLMLPSQPSKVGIFLDYDGGQISFYDVKARLHLYTFVDTFSESLYPIFSPCLIQEGKNASPLVITPVKHI